MGLVQNVIRVGFVSSVDTGQQMIRATFPDRDDQVSDWLQLVIPPIEGASIKMPAVGEQVLCLFLGNGLETGFWLGTVGDD
ncbi:phage baseplate assembly protein V [Paenibacillus sp. GCM10027626]|uniref:phage baseplate assembly protein V n=1 Tax=Paenibacillus sp. GCM10027626 TaxID=3273411 RepID=UPI00363A26C6